MLNIQKLQHSFKQIYYYFSYLFFYLVANFSLACNLTYEKRMEGLGQKTVGVRVTITFCHETIVYVGENVLEEWIKDVSDPS